MVGHLAGTHGGQSIHDADLLVVGSVGLVGARRVLLGSVATTVLHHAPCDVLVVDTA